MNHIRAPRPWWLRLLVLGKAGIGAMAVLSTAAGYMAAGGSFSTPFWAALGGIYALATLRGGGEYGEKWHQAGMKLNKQNVFDDFIGAARWLIQNKYTCPSKLAIGGRSNGGLLTAACLTQEPRLFGAVIVGVGVLDMLRYHKFTIGWVWKTDYGCAENREEFEVLMQYSPLHNCKKAHYPPTLITTGDHDDRVFPAHSYKFAAALQKAQQGESPILLRVERNVGHGAGTPTYKMIEEATDAWSFLCKSLQVTLPKEFLDKNCPNSSPLSWRKAS